MNNELEEALKFFGLDRDFTRDDWHDTYRLLGKKNHPDVNHETEEYMKLVNSHKAILESYELQNRSEISKRLDDKKDSLDDTISALFASEETQPIDFKKLNDSINEEYESIFGNSDDIDILKLPKTVKHFKSYYYFNIDAPLEVNHLIFDGTEEQFSKIENVGFIEFNDLTTK